MALAEREYERCKAEYEKEKAQLDHLYEQQTLLRKEARQLLPHQGNQIAYPYLFPWLYFQYVLAGMQIHAGIEIRCGNVFKLFPCTNFMNEGAVAGAG